uniref:Uncharacterized protein n=1 Tax=Anguilla anguilla TaxID=7936 RepID=A0A0E9R513_ANGAN
MVPVKQSNLSKNVRELRKDVQKNSTAISDQNNVQSVICAVFSKVIQGRDSSWPHSICGSEHTAFVWRKTKSLLQGFLKGLQSFDV